MYIDLVIYPIILFLGYLYGKGEEKDTNKKRFIYSASILLLMKISLRSVSVGADTCHYALYFIEMHKQPWSEILKLFIIHIGEGAVLGMGAVAVKDIPAHEVWVGNPAKFLKKK